MARAGDTTHRLIRLEDAAGTAITGAVIGDFTVTAYGRGYAASVWSTYTHGSTLTEIGGGLYALAFVLPPSAGWFLYRLTPTDATRLVVNSTWEGEIETQDLDSVYANVVKQVILPTQGALLGNTVPAQLVAYRYNRWAIPIVDSAGDAIDLTTYGNLALSVRSKDQTTKKLDASHGSPTGFVLTGSAAGILTVEWPESTGSSAADIYAWLTAPNLSADPLYYEVTGDIGSVSTKTVPLIRSSELYITRREVGS